MITEQGRVVAIEDDGVWVETANQSACSRCVARKGCGQSLLVQVDGHRSYIKAALKGVSPGQLCVGDIITIGVHESAVTRGSLLVYCVPLLGLIGGASAGDWLQLSEGGVAACALFGLAIAALCVRWISRKYQSDDRFHPVVVQLAQTPAQAAGEDSAVQVLDSAKL